MSNQVDRVLFTCVPSPKYPERCSALREQACSSGRSAIYRFELRRVALAATHELPHCRDVEGAVAIARGELWGLDRERLIAIYLNALERVIGIEIVAIGVEGSCDVTMTTLFRGALVTGARAIILAHNHPSGDVTPSPEDVHLMRKARQVGFLLDCPLFDFLIVTDDSIYSDLASIEAGRNHA
jgi:DNA repair protein RadC